jgi:hypothetical protein
MHALSTPFGDPDGLFTLAERVRYAPFLPVDGAFFLTVPAGDLWALRFLFERVLMGPRYSRYRGRWLERRANDVLAKALRPDELHEGVKIMSAHGKDELGELDGFLRFGDVALAVEAKSATMRPGARRGGEALITHLKETVKKAAEQAALARQVLHGEFPATLRTGDAASLEVGEDVREVHSILVTLDDTSAVGPVLWEVEGTTVLPESVGVPLVLTLHDLELLCGTVESPIQFVHYLRCRSRMNQLGGRVAVEELDWWMLYLTVGLYFEDDPSPGRVRYLSQTDALDAWVLYDHGLRDESAPKPRQRLDPDSRRLLGALSRERPPGWMAGGCILLSVAADIRAAISDDIRDARQRATQRNLVQRHAYGFEDDPQPMLICSVVVPDGEDEALLAHLRGYVEQRLDEHGITSVVGFGFVASSRRAFDAMIVLEAPTWSLPLEPGARGNTEGSTD